MGIASLVHFSKLLYVSVLGKGVLPPACLLAGYFVRPWTGNLTSWFYSNVFHCSLLLPNFLAKGPCTVQGKDVSCPFPVFRLDFRLNFRLHLPLNFRLHFWFHFRLHFRIYFRLCKKCTIDLIGRLISSKGVPGFSLHLVHRVSYL